MAVIRIRGGDFPVGALCLFRNDALQALAAIWPGERRIPVSRLRRGSVIERQQLRRMGWRGKVASVGAGVVVGASFGPPGMAVGGVIGLTMGIGKAERVTFEIEIDDGRRMVGTMSGAGWTALMESWRLAQHPATAPTRPRAAMFAPLARLLSRDQSSR